MPVTTIGLALLAYPVPFACAQCANETAQLVANSGAQGDRFGWAVALDDRTALISARTRGQRAGAVHVFERTGGRWTELQLLAPAGAAPGALFGNSIDLDGNVALIGASEADTNPPGTGAAYVFDRAAGSWTETQRLAADDLAIGDEFGFDGALDGSTALVGAWRHGGTGAAYFFESTPNGWVQTQKIAPDELAPGDAFGQRVALVGDTAAISAHLQNGSRGSVYLFQRHGGVWTQSRKLVAPTARAGDEFGIGLDVAANGRTMMIGAYAATVSGQQAAGRVHLLEQTAGTWSFRGRLVAPNPSAGALFGLHLALDGDRAVIGASGESAGRGAAYLCRRTAERSWQVVQRLVASDGQTQDNFGRGLDLSGETAIAGSIFDITATTWTGAAYAFDWPLARAESFGDGWAGTLGTPSLALSAPPIGGSDVAFTMTNSRGQDTPGIVLCGPSAVVSPTAFGGALLVGEPLSAVPVSVPAIGWKASWTVWAACRRMRSSVFLQGVLLDPGASHGLAFTPGLALTIGN